MSDVPSSYDAAATLPTLKEYVVRDMMTGMYLRSEGHWDPKHPRRFKRLSDLASFLKYFDKVKTTWEVIEFTMVETSRFSAATLCKDPNQVEKV